MVTLDPEEERLLAEAMFETADEDLSGPVMEITENAHGEKDEENVPNSKVQFPIRRSKYSRQRKVFGAMTFLTVLVGAFTMAYFLLKANTISFELKLSKGQLLHYRLTQEHTFEGLRSVHSSFAEDVFVQVVNETGRNCWMKVLLKTLPNVKNGPYVILVNVNLEGHGSVSVNVDDEKRLKVLVPWKNNNTLDYYVLNLLTQLLPVVKIDLFELILSQITTRKHEVVLESSKFFPGDATMKQNIRMSKDDIIISSRISPEGFSLFGSNANKQLPNISFNFEENTSISKSTGMITTSDMELTTRVPISAEVTEKSQTVLSMRFKSSLHLVGEQETLLFINRPSYNLRDITVSAPPTPFKGDLKYYSPSVKEYYENSNMVDTIKEMLNMTILNDFAHSTRRNRNKDLEAFARSFHKISEPGVETHFEEVIKNRKRFHGKTQKSSTTPIPTTTGRERLDKYNDGDDYIDNDTDEPSDYDDYDDDQYNNDGPGRQYTFGQPPPLYPDDDDDNDDDEGPPETGEEEADKKNARKKSHKHGFKLKYAESPSEAFEEKKQTDKNIQGKGPENHTHDTTKGSEHNKAEKLTSQALYKAGKKSIATKRKIKYNKPQKKGGKSKKGKTKKYHKKTKIGKTETVKTENKDHESGQFKILSNKTSKSGNTGDGIYKSVNSSPQHEEKTFFDRIFDQLWNDEDTPVEQSENADDGGFKLASLIPSFSFSSDFPFIHVNWDKSNSRKKRSIESSEQRTGRNIKVHRDERRLFEAPYYTSHDLKPIWDVVSQATFREHPKQILQVFQQMIMGLDIQSELQHEVKILNDTQGVSENWEIHISLLLSVDRHKFRVLNKVISMKEIEERFLRNAKPKLEYGTVHAGTLVLCSPFFYIENICVEIQLGFVLHVSHTIEYMSKEFPIELSIIFKNLAKVDATISSHMTSLLGSHGVFGQGPLFGAKIPLEIRFSEETNSAKWCSTASVKSKTGYFFEGLKDMNQWGCPVTTAVKKNGVCDGLYRNSSHEHKASNKFWYSGSSSKKIYFLNNC